MYIIIYVKVKFQTDSDENILLVTKKNKLLFILVLFIALFIIFSGIFLTINKPEMKSLWDWLFYNYLIWPFIFALEAIFIFWFHLYIDNNFYLTNKRIIFTSKSIVRSINFSDVKDWSAVGNALIVKTINNEKFNAGGVANTADFFTQFENFLPKNSTKKNQILLWIALISGVMISNIGSYYLDKLPLPYDKQPSVIYINNIERKIKSNWDAPAYDKTSKIIVSFIVQTDGTVKDIKIKQSSGNAELDNSVIVALKKSSPLPKLPKELSKNGFVQIEFTFDYNVFIR